MRLVEYKYKLVIIASPHRDCLYQITEISGTDGLWKMWLARNKYTKEVVLARCYTSNLNEQQIQELLSEVHVHKIEVSKVPNVLKCLGYYEEGGVNRHLVFENPKGGELFDRIVARTSYSEDNSRKLVRKLLRVVLELHNRHIVHRCITAHTIYLRSLDDDTDILVGDFEFALKTTGNASLSTPCGNPAYVAPEVLSGKPYSLACDMWSVGVVTFVLLCGYYPFEQKDLKRQFSAIRKGKYSFNPPRNSQVSADAERFIAALLKLDPTRRATAEEALLHSW
jgi:serine/threonine protein kinase